MEMILEIEIRNWAKYNPRSDVKSCSWFRMSNDFFSDPDFYGCSVVARISWIFILSIASKKMASIVRINTEMMTDSLKISEEILANALHELEMTNAVTVLDGNVKSIRSDSIVRRMLPSATNERTDERTNNIPASPIMVSGDLKTKSKKNLPKTQTQKIPKPILFEPEAPSLEEDIELSDLARNVLTALNSICDKSFRPTQGNMKFINARCNEKYKFEDFVSVIKFKQEQWSNDAKMRAYLRPETIFGTKFDGYLQESKNANKPIVDPLYDFFIRNGCEPMEAV